MIKLYMYTFPPIHNLSFGLLQTARSKQVDHRKIYATHSPSVVQNGRVPAR